ncbi:MAG: hypothetical protein ACO4BW_05000, partial [Nitriliruptoraceae bacterium]
MEDGVAPPEPDAVVRLVVRRPLGPAEGAARRPAGGDPTAPAAADPDGTAPLDELRRDLVE